MAEAGKTYSSMNELDADFFPDDLRDRIEEFFIEYYGESKYRAMEIHRSAHRKTKINN